MKITFRSLEPVFLAMETMEHLDILHTPGFANDAKDQIPNGMEVYVTDRCQKEAKHALHIWYSHHKASIISFIFREE